MSNTEIMFVGTILLFVVALFLLLGYPIYKKLKSGSKLQDDGFNPENLEKENEVRIETNFN